MGIRVKVTVTKGKTDFKKLENEFPKIVGKTIDEITEFLVKRSRPNAPILTGALRKSIQPSPTEIKKTSVSSGVESGLPYALKVHEHPFKLGKKSAKQPTTPEGGVGNKYIERVFNFYKGWIKWMWEKTLINLE